LVQARVVVALSCLWLATAARAQDTGTSTDTGTTGGTTAPTAETGDPGGETGGGDTADTGYSGPSFTASDLAGELGGSACAGAVPLALGPALMLLALLRRR
jgi:hypothetical protein